jgi:hypothetical protein
MRWSDLSVSGRNVRQFGAAACMLCLGVALWLIRSGITPAALVWGLTGLALAAAGLLAPRVLRPILVVATLVTFPLGWVVSNAMLALLYYLIITPVGLIFRLFGRDVLRQRVEPGCETYWEARVPPVNPGQYLRQY